MLDALVIGAGAAGLAAARTLADAGQTVLLLEARDRIGGRVWTATDFAAFPVELGAEFIHGEQTLTIDFVRQAGLTLLPAPRYAALRWSAGGRALPLAELAPATRTTIAALRQAYAALAALPAEPDRSLADYLRAAGFDAAALELADVLLAQTCCASVETLSCADLARELRLDRAGAQEFRIAEGYAALLAWLARGLDIRLGTAARHVRRSPSGVTVQTDQGVFQARRCIITLPPPVLAARALRFDPPLPPTTRAAIEAFRTEPATKLIYRFAAPIWDAALVYMAHTGLAARWWTAGHGRPGAAVISAYVTAERARALDALPEAAALALGLQELGVLLGTDAAAACVAARRVAWAADPLARGGYAHLPPGAANARVALAQPVDQTIWFAGEATAHWTNPQTVHGALESGIRAAQGVYSYASSAGS